MDLGPLDQLVGTEPVPEQPVDRVDERALEHERAVDDVDGVHGADDGDERADDDE